MRAALVALILARAVGSQAEPSAPPAETARDGAKVETVVVIGHPSAYAIRSAVSATKIDVPLIETPFSVSGVSLQVLRDQQATRLEDALTNVAGVRRIAHNANLTDEFLLRGFAGNTTYRDGFRSATPGHRDLASVERVEVLKGPGSILYGRAEPGGIINVVTKQPSADRSASLSQQIGSWDFYRTAAESTGPLDDDGDWLYRFDAAYETSGSFRDFEDSERLFLAPKLSWQPNEATRVVVEVEHLDDHVMPIPRLPELYAVGGIGPVPRRTNLGEPSAFVDAQTTLVGVHWSRALGDAWTLRHRFNASLFDQHMLNFYITGPVDPDYVDETIFNRGVQSTRRETDVYFNGVDLTGELETGPLRHTLLVGGDHLRETNEIPRLIVVEDIPELAIDVYAPTHLTAPLSLDPSLNRPLSGVVTWYGLYAQDQIELPGGWFVLAGVRYDDARTNRRRSGVQGAQSHDDRVSPRAGVLWRPLDELSIYASYTENFGQPHEMDPSEPPLPPELADQWEVGVKAELGGRLSASLAWFDLTKRNIAAADEDGDTIVIGAAEAKGIEAELSGEIVPGLRVIAGYAYMPFAKVTRDSAPILDDNGDPIGSGTEPATTGNRLFAVPRHQGSVFATYAIEHGPLAGLKVGGGAVHGGNVFNDLYEEIRLPRYTLVNLHASWAFALRGLSATAQLNVENLTDRRYFNYGAQFGPPRSAMASLRVEF